MRISLDINDTAYNPEAKNIVSNIFLNSKQIGSVITADDKLGYIKRYDIGPYNKLGANFDEIPTEELYGKVEIVFKPINLKQ